MNLRVILLPRTPMIGDSSTHCLSQHVACYFILHFFFNLPTKITETNKITQFFSFKWPMTQAGKIWYPKNFYISFNRKQKESVCVIMGVGVRCHLISNFTCDQIKLCISFGQLAFTLSRFLAFFWEQLHSSRYQPTSKLELSNKY